MSSAPSPHLPLSDGESLARLRDRRLSSLPPLAPVRATPDEPSAIAARVAERWRAAPSYGELLAAGVLAAETAAEAAQAAHAAAEAALARYKADTSLTAQLPAHEFDVFADPFFTESGFRPEDRGTFFEDDFDSFTQNALAVEHHAPLPGRLEMPIRASAPAGARPRIDALAEATIVPAQTLPARLIEFPRELIAPRRQRPRLAEGPLLEPILNGEQAPGIDARIFSRETDQAGGGSAARADFFPSMTDPRKPERTSEPARRRGGFVHVGTEAAGRPDEGGWGSIRLGEHPQAESAALAPAYKAEAAPSLEGLAPLSDRLMAALVDGSVVFACFLLSVLVFASSTLHIPTGKAALACALLAFIIQAVFYGWLFMSFGGGSTPGMRYARIALCTFRDENPTRRELKSRIPATALAMLPLGVGVLWALLDEDHLGWHDRMTRTYQRSYR